MPRVALALLAALLAFPSAAQTIHRSRCACSCLPAGGASTSPRGWSRPSSPRRWQPFIVENRVASGESWARAAREIARDGYAIMITFDTFASNRTYTRSCPTTGEDLRRHAAHAYPQSGRASELKVKTFPSSSPMQKRTARS